MRPEGFQADPSQRMHPAAVNFIVDLLGASLDPVMPTFAGSGFTAADNT